MNFSITYDKFGKPNGYIAEANYQGGDLDQYFMNFRKEVENNLNAKGLQHLNVDVRPENKTQFDYFNSSYAYQAVSLKDNL